MVVEVVMVAPAHSRLKTLMGRFCFQDHDLGDLNCGGVSPISFEDLRLI